MIIFALFCFLIVLALLISVVIPGFLNDMNVGFYLAITASFSLAGFIILIRKNFSFFKTLSIYICGFLTVFILVEAALIYYSVDDIPTGNEQAIIVPGSGLFVESRLTEELEERLNTAIDIYRQNPELPIVLSGGTDENRALPQSTAMKAYLEKQIKEKGLSMPQTIIDDKSSGLYNNITTSLARDTWNIPGQVTADAPSAYVIVSRHNVARTKIILNRISSHSTVIGAQYPLSKYIIYFIREFGFAAKTFLFEGII